MIEPELFYKILKSNGIDFFTGVPDSILKGFNNYLVGNLNDNKHIIAANEGGAVAIAAGYHLATKKTALVYMQNSGQGNAINPLTSLVHKDVYSMPVMLLIGWRGRPGVKDEPQHLVQGRITPEFLKVMGIPCKVLTLDINKTKKEIASAIKYLKLNQSPYALIVEKNFFSNYDLPLKFKKTKKGLIRESVIGEIVSILDNDYVIISTTGKTSRELFEHRELAREKHDKDFLVVGSMGHASQIALGIALTRLNKKVICLDGDGAAIMHMGGFSVIGRYRPKNLLHIILNNEVHESVGGQPTSAFTTDLCKIATACGYEKALKVNRLPDVKRVIKSFKNNGPTMLEIKIKAQSRKDLGRPSIPLKNLKEDFIKKVGNI